MARLPAVFQFLRGAVLILLCLYAGNTAKQLLHLILPGSILGLFLMLALLGSGLVPLAWIEPAATSLLFVMPALFVPIYVLAAEDKNFWIQSGAVILPIMVFSVLAMWFVIGHLSQFLLPGRKTDL